MSAPKLERGCGKRVKGGLYACCGLSPNGEPIEYFLIDPPGPYNGKPFRAPIIQEKEGVKNLIFWVGAQYYPFCPDYIEETRHLGISKRIPLSIDLSGLEPFTSRMYFIHPRAIIEGHIEKVHECPKDKEDHLEGKEFCINSLYYFVDTKIEDGRHIREIGSTKYGVSLVNRSLIPSYKPGIFMWAPFSHLEYVMPDSGVIDDRVKDLAKKDGITVLTVNE